MTGLECVRATLGPPDESGRRKPEPMQGTEFVVSADMIISAIGEVPELSFLEGHAGLAAGTTLKVNPGSFATNVPGVFAGGDAVTGPATVIEAIAAGRKAAIAMNKYLRGQAIDEEEVAPLIIGIGDVELARFKKHERQEMPEAPVNERIMGFDEVELGFSELTALFEADRCFQCGLFPNKDR